MSLAMKRARFATQGGLSGNVQAGGFGSFFGGLAEAAAGTLPVVGPGITAAINLTRRRGSAGGAKKPGPPGLTLPGFTPGEPTRLSQQRFNQRQQVASTNGQAAVACPSGFHPNRSSYFTLAGFVPKGTRCVKNRRRNPMNAQALDRAIRRVDAGKGLQGKLAEITTKKWTASGKKKEACS